MRPVVRAHSMMKGAASGKSSRCRAASIIWSGIAAIYVHTHENTNVSSQEDISTVIQNNVSKSK